MKRVIALLVLLCASTSAQADETMLRESWAAYVKKFVQKDGRVIDPTTPPGVTTSEGQAYALFRSVWMDDRQLFERIDRWTMDNLMREGSLLPAWKWGQREDRSWGIIDSNSASDADIHLAIALYAASQRWSIPSLGERATAIAGEIWEKEVQLVGGRWYLLPGGWAASEHPIPLNLSYYSPALFRRMRTIDPSHPWEQLVETTYYLLRKQLPITRLPPDWVFLEKPSNEIRLGLDNGSLNGKFGHDAYRVYFNVSLDYLWDSSSRARGYLERQSWLVDYFKINQTLPRTVRLDSIPTILGPEPLALYASLYPMLTVFHRDVAGQVRGVLRSNFKQGLWGDGNDYYTQNLGWMGLALGSGNLPPLFR